MVSFERYLHRSKVKDFGGVECGGISILVGRTVAGGMMVVVGAVIKVKLMII